MHSDLPAHPRPLTDRQERFIHEYLIDHNASAAAVRAGYSEKSKGSTAAELLQDERICARIAVEMADLFAQLKVNALDLMRRQLNLADLDPAKLFDDDEEAIPIKALDEDTRRALNVNYDRRRGETVMKVRSTPRHIALAALWRRFDVMMKMRALVLVEGRESGEREKGAAGVAPAVPSRTFAPIDPMNTPVGRNLQRIVDEARVRDAREKAERAQQAGQAPAPGAALKSPLKSPLEVAEEEADARLREAREEEARAQAAYARVRKEEEARAVAAAQAGPGEVLADGAPVAEAPAGPATAPEPGQASRPVEAKPAGLFPVDAETLRREREECERAREADIDRRVAQLMARDGKLPPGEGPRVWRAARAAWASAVKVAQAQRETRRAREAKLFAPKPTPEPEMKQSLLEHLQRVVRKAQQDELRGAAGKAHAGRIAPGVIINAGGANANRRPPGYNPPWERDTRPRYAEGREFEWSV